MRIVIGIPCLLRGGTEVQAVNSLSGPIYAVDVGAFHGCYALVLGALIKKGGGKVLAIEPNPQSYALLVDNIRRNELGDTVIAVQCAASDVESARSSISLQGSQSQVIKDRVASASVRRGWVL